MSLPPHEGGLSPAMLDRLPARLALRVGIVHGHRMTADLLAAYAAGNWGCEVVAVETNGRDGISAVSRAAPDIVVVGHAPPMVEACAVVGRLRKAVAAAKLIVTARRISEYLVHHLAGLEFHGVVDETAEGIATIRAAVERVREGSRFLSPNFVQLAARLRANPDAFPKLLSGRQEEVLVCIAHAMDDQEIARCLHMSARTAQRHRADIMRKLGVHGTPRLIRYCMETGFTDAAVPVSGEGGGA